MSDSMKPDTQYYKLGEKTDTQDIIEFFNERLEDFNYPVTPKFYFQANIGQKNTLIKISKIQDQYREEMKADILVQVNPAYFDDFRVNNDLDNLTQILFDQEIDKIKVDGKSGKVTIKANSIKASKGIIEKFNFDDVARAEEIESLYEKQKKDQES